ncbi:hypothetical protein HOC35_01080 [Candidatus Woesearchaeota archaeon]|nr:hypothetical protein [Candidatus Woesearchaeota archaeon]
MPKRKFRLAMFMITLVIIASAFLMFNSQEYQQSNKSDDVVGFAKKSIEGKEVNILEGKKIIPATLGNDGKLYVLGTGKPLVLYQPKTSDRRVTIIDTTATQKKKTYIIDKANKVISIKPITVGSKTSNNYFLRSDNVVIGLDSEIVTQSFSLGGGQVKITKNGYVNNVLVPTGLNGVYTVRDSQLGLVKDSNGQILTVNSNNEQVWVDTNKGNKVLTSDDIEEQKYSEAQQKAMRIALEKQNSIIPPEPVGIPYIFHPSSAIDDARQEQTVIEGVDGHLYYLSTNLEWKKISNPGKKTFKLQKVTPQGIEEHTLLFDNDDVTHDVTPLSIGGKSTKKYFKTTAGEVYDLSGNQVKGQTLTLNNGQIVLDSLGFIETYRVKTKKNGAYLEVDGMFGYKRDNEGKLMMVNNNGEQVVITSTGMVIKKVNYDQVMELANEPDILPDDLVYIEEAPQQQVIDLKLKKPKPISDGTPDSLKSAGVKLTQKWEPTEDVKKPTPTSYSTATGKQVYSCGSNNFCLKMGKEYFKLPSSSTVPVKSFDASGKVRYALLSGKLDEKDNSAAGKFRNAQKEMVDTTNDGILLGVDNGYGLFSVESTEFLTPSGRVYVKKSIDKKTKQVTTEFIVVDNQGNYQVVDNGRFTGEDSILVISGGGKGEFFSPVGTKIGGGSYDGQRIFKSLSGDMQILQEDGNIVPFQTGTLAYIDALGKERRDVYQNGVITEQYAEENIGDFAKTAALQAAPDVSIVSQVVVETKAPIKLFEATGGTASVTGTVLTIKVEDETLFYDIVETNKGNVYCYDKQYCYDQNGDRASMVTGELTTGDPSEVIGKLITLTEAPTKTVPGLSQQVAEEAATGVADTIKVGYVSEADTGMNPVIDGLKGLDKGPGQFEFGDAKEIQSALIFLDVKSDQDGTLSLKEYQQRIIDRDLGNKHYCEEKKCYKTKDKNKEVSCYGNIADSKCVPSGIADPQTQNAMVADLRVMRDELRLKQFMAQGTEPITPQLFSKFKKETNNGIVEYYLNPTSDQDKKLKIPKGAYNELMQMTKIDTSKNILDQTIMEEEDVALLYEAIATRYDDKTLNGAAMKMKCGSFACAVDGNVFTVDIVNGEKVVRIYEDFRSKHSEDTLIGPRVGDDDSDRLEFFEENYQRGMSDENTGLENLRYNGVLTYKFKTGTALDEYEIKMNNGLIASYSPLTGKRNIKDTDGRNFEFVGDGTQGRWKGKVEIDGEDKEVVVDNFGVIKSVGSLDCTQFPDKCESAKEQIGAVLDLIQRDVKAYLDKDSLKLGHSNYKLRLGSSSKGLGSEVSGKYIRTHVDDDGITHYKYTDIGGNEVEIPQRVYETAFKDSKLSEKEIALLYGRISQDMQGRSFEDDGFVCKGKRCYVAIAGWDTDEHVYEFSENNEGETELTILSEGDGEVNPNNWGGFTGSQKNIESFDNARTLTFDEDGNVRKVKVGVGKGDERVEMVYYPNSPQLGDIIYGGSTYQKFSSNPKSGESLYFGNTKIDNQYVVINNKGKVVGIVDSFQAGVNKDQVTYTECDPKLCKGLDDHFDDLVDTIEEDDMNLAFLTKLAQEDVQNFNERNDVLEGAKELVEEQKKKQELKQKSGTMPGGVSPTPIIPVTPWTASFTSGQIITTSKGTYEVVDAGEHTKAFKNKKTGETIYYDAKGDPVGYTEKDKTKLIKYKDGELGPQAKALKEEVIDEKVKEENEAKAKAEKEAAAKAKEVEAKAEEEKKEGKEKTEEEKAKEAAEKKKAEEEKKKAEEEKKKKAEEEAKKKAEAEAAAKAKKEYKPPENIAGLDSNGDLAVCDAKVEECDPTKASFMFKHDSVFQGTEGFVYVKEEKGKKVPCSAAEASNPNSGCSAVKCDKLTGCKHDYDGDTFCTTYQGEKACATNPVDSIEKMIEDCDKNSYKGPNCPGAQKRMDKVYDTLNFEFRSRVESVFGTLLDDWTGNFFNKMEYWLYDSVCTMDYYNTGSSETDVISGLTITQEHNFGFNLGYLDEGEIIATIGGEREIVDEGIYRYSFSLQTIGALHGIVYLYNKCDSEKSFESKATGQIGWNDEFVVNNPKGVHRTHYAGDETTFICDEIDTECRFDYVCLKIMDVDTWTDSQKEKYTAPICTQLGGDEFVITDEGDYGC